MSLANHMKKLRVLANQKRFERKDSVPQNLTANAGFSSNKNS